MNEVFAADPTAIRDSIGLRYLLHLFGPATGRYLCAYPSDWAELVQALAANSPTVEQERIKTLLRRAREEMRILSRPLPWHSTESWLSNAHPLARRPEPATFHALILPEGASSSPRNCEAYVFDDLDLGPTSEERISPSGEELARVARTLLVTAPELAIVDPYLRPEKKAQSAALKALLAVVSRGKARRVALWARHAEVAEGRDELLLRDELTAVLARLAAVCGLPEGTVLEMILVADEKSPFKIHERCLISIKGGVRVDQGFQTLPAGRLTTVSPMSETAHAKAVDAYLSEQDSVPPILLRVRVRAK